VQALLLYRLFSLFDANKLYWSTIGANLSFIIIGVLFLVAVVVRIITQLTPGKQFSISIKLPWKRSFLTVQGEFHKNIGVERRKLCFLGV
jgi:hypothetical protein